MAGVIVLIVLAAYNFHPSEGLWRVNFGLGMVLPVGLLFVRLRLVNSTQYKKHAMKAKIPYMLVIRRYWKPMVGTSMAWFMYDFVVCSCMFILSGEDGMLIKRRHTLLEFLGLQSSRHLTPTTPSRRLSVTELF